MQEKQSLRRKKPGFKFTALEFPLSLDLDKEGAQHVSAKAGNTAYSGLQHYPGAMDNRYLLDEERNAIIIVERFCMKRGLEHEVIDLGKGILEKLRFKLKGVASFTAVMFEKRWFTAFQQKALWINS